MVGDYFNGGRAKEKQYSFPLAEEKLVVATEALRR
jgi:hypothetical protein